MKMETQKKKKGYGFDEYYEEERNENHKKYGLEQYYEEEQIVEINVQDNGGKHSMPKKRKRRKKRKSILKRILRIIIILIILIIIGIFLFFKTSLFQEYKELWVLTAMSTMNHQYLATWFLSNEEIQAILKKNEIKNEENSSSNQVTVVEPKKIEEIKVEKITGNGYVGFVMTIPDASKVKLVDGRKASRGSKLSEIVKENNAIAGINAGGFYDPDGVGNGNILCDVVIMDKELISGNKTSSYSLIGLSSDHKLVLGNYTYAQAINAGIESAVEFGPFLIVNGNNQIGKSNAGGIHPRMGIGQKQTGEFIFVCIDGRQPGYSVGTTLLELQNIFERYGAYNAANLDGGSSATMYYNGQVVNSTSTPMGERYLPNAFIVKQ